ncbi:futalosine hydrolase [Paenibacillus profundus]|uniref:Futalosine hydrolase n=1 Tax=Paenibacillus profundus TaxID=1173085 RepID=A0ABS8YF50_9BACL|nr:futalosine hydrolase [Paenibacillus profundus]MCE5170638.1 futalosine hydrolase [Paenibacillus profundus]
MNQNILKDSTSTIRVLIMTSVPAERDAVLRGLNGDARFDVVIGGVGTAAAAASTARALATAEYGLAVCAGIAGGFAGQADIGSLVLASEIVAADLGAETPEGFCSVDELGFGSARVPVDAGLTARLAEALRAAGLPVAAGPVLTLATVTGTAETAAELAARVPGAAAEAMEGYGVAVAAQACGVPVLELRSISNAVGPRNRDAWRIPEALKALEAASAVLMEVLR